jgi:hypothetical protein
MRSLATTASPRTKSPRSPQSGRYAAFRAANVKVTFRVALSLIAQLLANPKAKHKGLVEHCGAARGGLPPDACPSRPRTGRSGVRVSLPGGADALQVRRRCSGQPRSSPASAIAL